MQVSNSDLDFSLGEPTFTPHADECMLSEKQRLNRCFGFSYHCSCGAQSQPPSWPEWVADEVFEAAYRLAQEIQDKRGSWNRREADRLHRENQSGAAA